MKDTSIGAFLSPLVLLPDLSLLLRRKIVYYTKLLSDLLRRFSCIN